MLNNNIYYYYYYYYYYYIILTVIVNGLKNNTFGPEQVNFRVFFNMKFVVQHNLYFYLRTSNSATGYTQ